MDIEEEPTKRDNKRAKRNKMIVTGKSVFEIVRIQVKRAKRINNKKKGK
jgi:hypothetical protein